MQRVHELVPDMLALAAGRTRAVEGQSKDQLTLLEAWWDWSMGKEQKICSVAKQLLPENASWRTPINLQGSQVAFGAV